MPSTGGEFNGRVQEILKEGTLINGQTRVIQKGGEKVVVSGWKEESGHDGVHIGEIWVYI